MCNERDWVDLTAHASRGLNKYSGSRTGVQMAATPELDRIISRQNGVLSLDQAYAAGMTKAQVLHRLANGDWTRLATGVYSPASSTPTWERQLRAAVLGNA